MRGVTLVVVHVDGAALRVPAGVSVAAALLNAGVMSLRTSTAHEPRGPLCGMGICYECRVTIDGVAHRRACLTTVRDGMDIRRA